jgi:hypothetical protein
MKMTALCPPTSGATTVCRFSPDGLIAEHWGVLDMIGLLRQLGALPPAPWQQ